MSIKEEVICGVACWLLSVTNYNKQPQIYSHIPRPACEKGTCVRLHGSAESIVVCS